MRSIEPALLQGEHAGTEVAFTIGPDGIVRVERVDAVPRPALAVALSRLKGSAERRLTTEEIMALTRG